MNLIPIILTLFGIGIFCLLTKRNLIKTLIGIELLGKATTLAIIWGGVIQNNILYVQSLAVIIIIIEVIVVAVFLALIYAFHQKSNTLDTDELRRLQG